MSKSNLLVTGGTGLVGTALRELAPEAVYVSRKDADLTDLSQVRALFKKFEPSQVIHLAAKVGGVRRNAEQNADMLAVNVQINANVLSVAQEFKVQKLVGLLSSCTFQENPPRPPTEKDTQKGTPYHGHAGYAFSKRLLDLQIHLLHEQYGSRFTSILPVTIFGPGGNWDLQGSHVCEALICKCTLAQKNRTPLEVWGSGKAVRQFVYSGDVARVILEVLKNYDDPETIIVTPDQGITIKALAERIAKTMEFKGPIRYDASQPEGQRKKVLNGAKFKKVFPKFKFTPWEDALRSTADWFKNHYPENAKKS